MRRLQCVFLRDDLKRCALSAATSSANQPAHARICGKYADVDYRHTGVYIRIPWAFFQAVGWLACGAAFSFLRRLANRCLWLR